MNVAVVMPAFNVAETLEKTYRGLPLALRRHMILGDNQSTDGTAEVAERLGIQVLRHGQNYGYGGNLKRLFACAMAQGAEIIAELHPDFQYDPGLIDILVEYIRRDYFDVMQGSRIRSRGECLANGMHWYRYFGNRILTTFENWWFGVLMDEWHSGMKAYRSDVLRQLPLEAYPNNHAFANDILMDCVMRGYRVGEIPIPVRYTKESSSLSVKGLFDYTFRLAGSAIVRPPWSKRPFGAAQLPPLHGRQTFCDHDPADAVPAAVAASVGAPEVP